MHKSLTKAGLYSFKNRVETGIFGMKIMETMRGDALIVNYERLEKQGSLLSIIHLKYGNVNYL